MPSINLLRLVQFGEVNNLIHRLHCFPISIKPDNDSNNPKGASLAERIWRDLRSNVMDGVQSVDNLVYVASSKAVKETIALRKAATATDGAGPSLRTWDPKRYSSLPDAVVNFTSKLLVEERMFNAETDLRTKEEDFAAEMRRELSTGGWKEVSQQSKELETDGNTRFGKIYTLWH